eukprot:PhF_6_TR43374/c0_g1_i7/m.66522
MKPKLDLASLLVYYRHVHPRIERHLWNGNTISQATDNPTVRDHIKAVMPSNNSSDWLQSLQETFSPPMTCMNPNSFPLSAISQCQHQPNTHISRAAVNHSKLLEVVLGVMPNDGSPINFPDVISQVREEWRSLRLGKATALTLPILSRFPDELVVDHETLDVKLSPLVVKFLQIVSEALRPSGKAKLADVCDKLITELSLAKIYFLLRMYRVRYFVDAGKQEITAVTSQAQRLNLMLSSFIPVAPLLTTSRSILKRIPQDEFVRYFTTTSISNEWIKSASAKIPNVRVNTQGHIFFMWESGHSLYVSYIQKHIPVAPCEAVTFETLCATINWKTLIQSHNLPQSFHQIGNFLHYHAEDVVILQHKVWRIHSFIDGPQKFDQKYVEEYILPLITTAPTLISILYRIVLIHRSQSSALKKKSNTSVGFLRGTFGTVS